MLTVELVYDRDCPNIALARENLLRAFAQTGVAPHWQEWDRADPRTPAYARVFGSPALLVNGKDVSGALPSDAACCRVYADGAGAPSVAAIASTLSGAAGRNSAQRGMTTLLPAIGGALLPKLTCPICWPAYTALLSAVGLEFIDYGPYLLPLTAVFLAIALALLFRSARVCGTYLPLFVGTVGAALMLIGKFYIDSDVLNYAGIALLVIAFVWQAWPRKAESASCPACITDADRRSDDSLKGGVP